MSVTIVVVDGLGGGLGAQLVAGVRQEFGQKVQIIALGTNSAATERMLKAGADRGASGENAIRVSVRLGDFILGPIGLVVPDSLMGEISPAIAQSILEAPGERILIPVGQRHFLLAGMETKPIGRMVEDAIALAASRIDARARTGIQPPKD